MSTLGLDDLWERLTNGDESIAIEAKRGGKIDRPVLQSVSAFSNTPGQAGGYLLLGVAQNDGDLFGEPAFEIVGVSDPGKLQADLASQCRDSLDPPVRPRVTVEQRDSKSVLIAFVPEAPAQDKPVHIKSEGLPKGAYLRIGNTDQHCTEDDLAVLFQNRGTTTYDESPVDGATLEDVDPAALAEYRRARREVNPSATELRLSDNELLHALHATTNHRGTLSLTIAGLMLFGKEASLRRYFPLTRVDYIRVEGRDWVPDPENRYSAVEMRGPLMLLVPRVVQQVLSDIPMAFSLGESGVHRRDVPLVPRTVIREAIVNALMHRSYRVRAPVQIIRYTNRLEIRNPGHSLKPDDRLGEPGSIARNEKIAAALHEAGLAETKGTGIRAMREAMSRANLTLPIFETDRAKNEFTVRLLVHHLLGPEDVAWLAQFSDCNLSDDEAKALLVVREVGAIDNAVYRSVNRVDTLTASGALRRLRDLKLLDKKGKGNATYYVPTERVIGRSFVVPVTGTVGLARASQQSQGLAVTNPADKAQSQGFQPRATAGNPRDWSKFPDLPTHLQDQIRALGDRAGTEEIKQVILALCSWKPLQPSALGQLLGRNPEYLRSQYLAPMRKSGELEFTKPDPADPNQEYRTVPPERRGT